MPKTIILKHDTAANWAKAKNFIPKEGEMVMYIDMTPPFKIGDGIHNVNDLPFAKSEVNWNEVANAPTTIQKGSQTGSLIIGEGEAIEKYSIAGGTTNKQLISDIAGE